MGNEKVVLCTDDITPENLDKYWKYWETLKSGYPELKLNAFVIPHYKEKDSELILNVPFKLWYNQVKDWVSLHLHGYSHSFPPEYLLSYENQRNLIEKGARILGSITENTFGMKAPGYKYNQETIRIAKELMLDFIADEKRFIFIKRIPKNNLRPIELINTHTNGLCADSIEKIYESLNESLKDKEFLFIDELAI